MFCLKLNRIKEVFVSAITSANCESSSSSSYSSSSSHPASPRAVPVISSGRNSKASCMFSTTKVKPSYCNYSTKIQLLYYSKASQGLWMIAVLVQLYRTCNMIYFRIVTETCSVSEKCYSRQIC